MEETVLPAFTETFECDGGSSVEQRYTTTKGVGGFHNCRSGGFHTCKSISAVRLPSLASPEGFSFPAQKVLPSPAGSTSDIMTSDHSPVFATFEAGVTSQFVSKHGTCWVVGGVCRSVLRADGRPGHSSSGCSSQLSALDDSSFQASP